MSSAYCRLRGAGAIRVIVADIDGPLLSPLFFRPTTAGSSTDVSVDRIFLDNLSKYVSEPHFDQLSRGTGANQEAYKRVANSIMKLSAKSHEDTAFQAYREAKSGTTGDGGMFGIMSLEGTLGRTRDLIKFYNERATLTANSSTPRIDADFRTVKEYIVNTQIQEETSALQSNSILQEDATRALANWKSRPDTKIVLVSRSNRFDASVLDSKSIFKLLNLDEDDSKVKYLVNVDKLEFTEVPKDTLLYLTSNKDDAEGALTKGYSVAFINRTEGPSLNDAQIECLAAGNDGKLEIANGLSDLLN